MTAKTPERLRREAARAFAAHLVAVAHEGGDPDVTESWLRDQPTGKFRLTDLVVVMAEMVPVDEGYLSLMLERFDPPPVKPR